MTRKRRMGLGLSMGLIVVGCAPTPESTFKEMKASACKGDVPGFFSHIDKTKVGESITEAALGQATANGPKGAVGKLGAAVARNAMPGVVQAGFTAWEDEIKKGEAGDLCKMQFVSATEAGDTGTVNWKTPSGVDKVYTLQRFDKKWLVVGMK